MLGELVVAIAVAVAEALSLPLLLLLSVVVSSFSYVFNTFVCAQTDSRVYAATFTVCVTKKVYGALFVKYTKCHSKVSHC